MTLLTVHRSPGVCSRDARCQPSEQIPIACLRKSTIELTVFMPSIHNGPDRSSDGSVGHGRIARGRTGSGTRLHQASSDLLDETVDSSAAG